MTLDDRLQLIRAGYTKAEIEEMTIAAEAPAAPDPAPAAPDPAPAAPDPAPAAPDPAPAAPDPAPSADAPAWAQALQASIEKLTRAAQQHNTAFDDMGDAIDTATRAEKALAEYITGKK